jgi:hypothetical protein
VNIERLIDELRERELDLAERQATVDKLRATASALRLRIEYALITLRRGT